MLCKSKGTACIARRSCDTRIWQWTCAYKVATIHYTYAIACVSLMVFKTSQRNSLTQISMPAKTAATSSLFEPKHVS